MIRISTYLGVDKRETPVENQKTRFNLRGFRQVMGFRVFTFEGVAADRTRSLFTVRADLALTCRYRVPLQELPLLCRAVLDRLYEGGEKRAFSFSEEDMRAFALAMTARAEAAKQRKAPRRPVSDQVGAAWRGPRR